VVWEVVFGRDWLLLGEISQFYGSCMGGGYGWLECRLGVAVEGGNFEELGPRGRGKDFFVAHIVED
jgi:hypothetical protein